MRLFDVLGYAFSDYASNKFKTMMSSLGIIIGVAAIITILTLGDGLYSGVSDQFGTAGADTILITPMSMDFPQSPTGGSSIPVAQFTDQDVNAILNVSGVASVHPQISVSAEVSFGGTNRSVNAVAIIPSYEQRLVPDIYAGRFLTDSDQFVAVIGNETAYYTFGKTISPGDYITLTDGRSGRSHDYIVAGVINNSNKSQLMSDSDSIIYTTKSGISAITDTISYSQIGVTAVSSAKADETAKLINATLSQMHQNQRFSVITMSTLTSMISSIFNMIKYVLAGIGAVSLVVGGIGIMNVMMLTVRERVKEIGLMKAIGSTTMDVRLIFLTESALLGFFSGLIGVIVAAIVAAIAGQLIGMSMGMSLTNVLLGVGFGLLITVVFGVYPANQAAKMDPIEALRTE